MNALVAVKGNETINETWAISWAEKYSGKRALLKADYEGIKKGSIGVFQPMIWGGDFVFNREKADSFNFGVGYVEARPDVFEII